MHESGCVTSKTGYSLIFIFTCDYSQDTSPNIVFKLSHMSPGVVSNWEMQSFSGFWNVDTAGGCSNYPETFAKNQKYLISLEGDADEDGKCSLIVSLMQKDRRQLRRQGLQLLTIGFAIYKVEQII